MKRGLKQLVWFSLLIALVGVPLGNALAQSQPPNGFGDPGLYYYFPIAPSGLPGGGGIVFDSALFLTGFAGAQVSLEVDTVGVLPGFPVQSTNVTVPAFGVIVLPSATGAVNFRCAPQPNVCQLFVHHFTPNVVVQDFFATLEVFTSVGIFQFIQPFVFVL